MRPVAYAGDARKRFNDPSLYLTLVQNLHALGISIQGCFVFGHDHDTTTVFDETVQFAIEAAIDLPRFAILTPFPGTLDFAAWEKGMGEGLRFLWNATRGNRLRPWRSPYLRWRLETFSGQKADAVRAGDFWDIFWKEKRQFLRFLRWTREMKSYSDTGE